MEKLYYKLNISSENAIKSNVNIGWDGGERAKINLSMSQYFEPSWISYFRHLGMKMDTGLVFYKPSNYSNNIHVDPFEGKTWLGASVNIVAHPKHRDGKWDLYPDYIDDSYMTWYDPDSVKVERKFITEDNITFDYLWADEKDAVEIQRCQMGTDIYLVNTQIPHQIITNKFPRLCFALRGTYSAKCKSWKDVVDWFGEKGLMAE